MTFDSDAYRKRWPHGLVTYPNADIAAIPSNAIEFLFHIGLPRGREPEWNFNGVLLTHSLGYQFGTHGVAPLLINETGHVIRSCGNEQTYVNVSIVHFAECLTLRKRPYRIGALYNDATALRLAFEGVDATAVSSLSLWGQYLIECAEEEREIAD